MTYIYLIRHAEAEGNLYRRIHGQYNSLITPRGKEQIKRLEERFRDIPIDAIYSSDLHRTIKTAAAVSRPKNLPIIPRPDLREIAMGVWEDLTWGDVERSEPDQLYAFNNDPLRWTVQDAEHFEAFQRRITDAIREIALQNRGKTVAIVTHGMALRAFAAEIMNIEPGEISRVPHSDNTSVSLLKVDENGLMEIEFYGDNAHIPEELSTFARQKWWREATTFDSSNMRFEPLCLDTQADIYLTWREKAWHMAYEGKEPPVGRWLDGVRRNAQAHSRAVAVAYLGGEPVGVIELDVNRAAGEKVGVIEFVYVEDEVRKTGKGTQLLGHAVSVYRPMGRERVRMSVYKENDLAIEFCERNGFCPVCAEFDGTSEQKIYELDITVPGEGA
ncbi:MAG TPA: GNAT family N-acetyltransferase [Papillibacter sp.]|jgi:probable phosphoglycerate mutase|nr:GNAT family N-acetyltransferase [Papillibacter sp.]